MYDASPDTKIHLAKYLPFQGAFVLRCINIAIGLPEMSIHIAVNEKILLQELKLVVFDPNCLTSFAFGNQQVEVAISLPTMPRNVSNSFLMTYVIPN